MRAAASKREGGGAWGQTPKTFFWGVVGEIGCFGEGELELQGVHSLQGQQCGYFEAEIGGKE